MADTSVDIDQRKRNPSIIFATLGFVGLVAAAIAGMVDGGDTAAAYLFAGAMTLFVVAAIVWAGVEASGNRRYRE